MPNEKNSNEEHGVRLSYKFRIYPTPSQCEAIKASIDASRFVHNHYLRARMDAYERTQPTSWRFWSARRSRCC